MDGGGDINKRDVSGRTALHISVSAGHPSVFYLLISKLSFFFLFHFVDRDHSEESS